MPKDEQIKKVLVIGSGPIVIGQAAEFDYAGTQACLTLKEEGCNVILINNNPATIMTDDDIADKVYFEPLTVERIEAIIKKEQPDGILMSVSGQTGLNLAFKLDEANIIEQYNLTVLGTPIEAIKEGEDRERFKHLMDKISEPTPESDIVDNLDDALQFSEQVGYPIIVRPAYTLGGSGGGIAHDDEQFLKYVRRGLRASPISQCLIEKSIAGRTEIEFEVVRDKANTAVVVCHMENIDPVGIHTGDSMVVAPIQTLTNKEIARLRAASLKIVKEIGIIGACNVQLAYEPKTKQYVIIEVNPRVSRSSALASKATGYPIAKIATKLSLGYTLDELQYERVGETLATFEPEFNYVIVKFPCFPFDKLTTADRTLGTQMKATGEVMAIEKTVAAGIQKAVRSLGLTLDGLSLKSLQKLTVEQLKHIVDLTDDRRFFAIVELIKRGITLEEIHETTHISMYFLEVFASLVHYESEAKSINLTTVTDIQLLNYKQSGFTNDWLSNIWRCTLSELKETLNSSAIYPVYDCIHAYSEKNDNQAAYYYVTWEKLETPPIKSNGNEDKVLIIGSGPIKIGQGIEFDYCSVQGVKALQKAGMKTILINNNPATVSTDYEIADKLYFEPVTAEDVLQVIEYEQIEKVMVQFGGQTSINLVKDLEAAGIQLLGAKMNTIDTLEDRERFYDYLQTISVPHIPGEIANSKEEFFEKTAKIDFPILIRPSYVIGGQGMEIIESQQELDDYVASQKESIAYPILIDAYYPGKEVEVDAATDGENIFVPAIFEHVEKAGVHSGDSMAVTPPVSLTEEMKNQIIEYTERIAQGIDFKGVFNIQFVIYNDTLYVLEVNPRASRTVPVISKVTGANLIEMAATALLGGKLQCTKKTLPENSFYTVKAPVFSTTKLPGVDPKLVPEMKSTGELIGVAPTFSESLTKAFIWNEHLYEDFYNKKKEIYIANNEAHFIELEKHLQELGIEPIYKTHFEKNATFEEVEEWMRTEAAFAMFCSNEVGTVRERATEFNLNVMSAEETVKAFSMMTNKRSDVEAIQRLDKAYEKEVVYE